VHSGAAFAHRLANRQAFVAGAIGLVASPRSCTGSADPGIEAINARV
jgi:hypothetical protein